jgi:hypothetical protein
VTILPDIEKYRPRKLQSIGDELDGDDEANAAWKLVPFYVVAALVVAVVASLRKAIRRFN